MVTGYLKFTSSRVQESIYWVDVRYWDVHYRGSTSYKDRNINYVRHTHNYRHHNHFTLTCTLLMWLSSWSLASQWLGALISKYASGTWLNRLYWTHANAFSVYHKMKQQLRLLLPHHLRRDINMNDGARTCWSTYIESNCPNPELTSWPYEVVLSILSCLFLVAVTSLLCGCSLLAESSKIWTTTYL